MPVIKSDDKLKTLRKELLKIEMKIDDMEEEIRKTANAKEKRALQNQLKKITEDPKMEQMKNEILLLEGEAKQAALQAAAIEKPVESIIKTNKKKDSFVAADATVELVETLIKDTIASGDKNMEPGRKLRQASQGIGMQQTLSIDFMSQLDEAFAAKEIQKKLGAVRCVKALSWCAPVAVAKIPELIKLFNDAKAGKSAIEAAKAICTECCPNSMPTLVLPYVVEAVNDKKKWKAKAGALEVLSVIIERLNAPKELAGTLAKMIPLCVDSAKDVRTEIQDNAQAVLKAIGNQVKNPEVRSAQEYIIKALVNPTDQKLTQDALMFLGGLTFMNYVDANALALLAPILIRALREREQKSRKWASQIFGACVKLVKEVDYLMPYLDELMPLMEGALMDPTPEVQREAAKAYAQLSHALPDMFEKKFRPLMCSLMRSDEENERLGGATAMSHIYHVLGKEALPVFLEECFKGTEDKDWRVRHSYLEVLDQLPALYKEDYAQHITDTMPVILRGSLDKEEFANAAGNRATSSMIAYFAPMCPELLFPAIRDLLFTQTEACDRLVVIKHINLLVTKIMDQKKFQQDILNIEVGHAKVRREIAVIMYWIWKGDSDGQNVRAIANSWKISGGSPKMCMAIIQSFRGLLKAAEAIENRPDIQKSRASVRSSLLDNKCTEEDLAAEVDAKDIPKMFATMKSYGQLEAADFSEANRAQRYRRSSSHGNLAEHMDTSKTSIQNAFKPLADSVNPLVLAYAEAIAMCILTEGTKRNQVLRSLHSELDKLIADLPKGHFESMVEELFPATADGEDDDDADELFRVDNMMLMYGGGHLLLKDTTLRMCKGRRYGIIGHNGAGKTTLMKLLASGGVANMPKDITCVHVSDAELGNLKVLEMSPVDFIAKDAPKGVDPAKALEDVDFPADMQNKLVSDLSGGWRMKLILARAMLKNADVLLLDEPTNHLDVQAIAWLENFLIKQNNASMMIISHEASFLNKVCTDVIQYRDKKLNYHHGSWDSFQASLGLGTDDAAKLLKGDLNMDADAQEDEDEDEKKVVVVAKQKLTFPIPGKLSGISSSSKAVMSMKNVWFSYNEAKGMILKGIDCKLSMGSRVAIIGRNGAGKSTLMSLLCREINPIVVEGQTGEVYRHHNLRLAFIAQHHMETLGKFYKSTPFQYLQHRFANGYDEELQKHLLIPRNEDEELRRKELGKKHGKYGLPVGQILGRTQKGKQLLYEVQWEGLTDSKQNTWETIEKLKAMDAERIAIACDERIQCAAAGNDQRQVSRREVIKHLEQFGIDEEMCCNRHIGSFSAGQKSKLALGASFWTRPHLVALDEPTNYLDPETVSALARALKWFRGGVVVITHNQGFIDEVCNETWTVADGQCKIESLKAKK